MKIYKFILLIGIIFFSFSCSKDSSDKNKDSSVPKVMENYNFYQNAEMYNNAQKLRSKDYSSAFDIEKVERNGKLLNVTLTYLGKCEVNKFDVIWDGILLESWPMQTRLIIKRSASNCDDTLLETETLSIDLMELIGDKVLVEGTVFYVSDGSKTSDEENADTVVSNSDQ
ncbi:MAG: hypothetical protein GX921_09040 [Bacteroidales bacterium]|nr:hypothetical protein [Bacteroidales bacterium]